MRSQKSEIIEASAYDHYSKGDDIWSRNDIWNQAKRKEIETFCAKAVASVKLTNPRTLNAGAGNNAYAWLPTNVVSLDRFPAQLTGAKTPVVSDVQALPFNKHTFDLVICIGSVINYTSAMETIRELGRVLKPGGWFLLHFETSNSFEHLLTDRWRASATMYRTHNNGKEDCIWVYSREYIYRLMYKEGISVQKKKGFHIFSSALIRLGISPRSSAIAQQLDIFAYPFSYFSDDVILLGQKST